MSEKESSPGSGKADSLQDIKDKPTPDSSSVSDTSFNVNEKALLRKLDMRLLPPLTLLYLLSFLDRSNGSTPIEHSYDSNG
jgi:hypothetical protein